MILHEPIHDYRSNCISKRRRLGDLSRVFADVCGLLASVYSLLYTSSYTVTSPHLLSPSLTSSCAFACMPLHVSSLYSISFLSSFHCSIDKPSRPPGLIIFCHLHILRRVNTITQPLRPPRLLLYHFLVGRQVKTLVPPSLP